MHLRRPRPRRAGFRRRPGPPRPCGAGARRGAGSRQPARPRTGAAAPRARPSGETTAGDRRCGAARPAGRERGSATDMSTPRREPYRRMRSHHVLFKLRFVEHPVTRILTLLELLQAYRRLSGTELARRLEVSPRTVRRYVADLHGIGIPVDAEAGRYGGLPAPPPHQIPPPLPPNGRDPPGG